MSTIPRRLHLNDNRKCLWTGKHPNLCLFNQTAGQSGSHREYIKGIRIHLGRNFIFWKIKKVKNISMYNLIL